MALTLTSVGCDKDTGALAEPTLPEAPNTSATLQPQASVTVDYVHPPNAPWLPAYNELGFKPNPLKGDQFDDIRAAAPENYAITEPPASTTLRAMVEWEPMQSIVMSYSSDMLGAQNATETMAKVAMHSATVADVWFIVNSQNAINGLTQTMLDVGMPQADIDNKVYFFEKATIDSIWFIDSGPVPVIDTTTNTYAFADFRYYHQRAYDDGVPSVLGRNLVDFGLPSNTNTYRMPVDTEGGTFMATSDGICFTGTRQLYNMSCMAGACNQQLETLPLDQLQDHPLTQELELQWGQYLGCKDVIITYSITDDGTGHIDMYLKVIDDDTVLIGNYPAPFANQAQQVNAGRMNANADFIDAYVKPGGGTMNAVRLVMPGHRQDNFGSVPFTYINSTFINGLNLWPATEYNDWMNSRNEAQATWETIMPDYTHQYIDATQLSFWSGAIHCVTRTIPALAPAKWVDDGTCDTGSDTCTAPTGGYDGECTPGVSSEDVCYGPAWECYCNNCALCPDGPIDPGPGPTGCGDITYEGCCDGNNLSFCENGSLQSGSCGAQGCGWVAQNGWYDCGGSGEDPSGQYPIQCGASSCTPDCDGKTCGDDGCGGSCGTCADGETCNAAGTCETGSCLPICDGKQCGSDGCGGSCGTCGDGQICEADGTCSSNGGGGDAGGPADAGSTGDGGATTPDAGPEPDAGSGGGDAGSSGSDAGSGGGSDGGSTGGDDTGSAGADAGNGGGGEDAVVSGDSTTTTDAGVPVQFASGGDGPGCEAASSDNDGAPMPALGLVLVLALAALRRRQ